MAKTSKALLVELQSEIVACEKCPRLVEWRRAVAHEKVRRFQAETYWGQPVPSFGDCSARVLIIGLAPAAHGANRTGRMFTGDRSGDWLYRALYRAGFANQATATDRTDGLTLTDCWISAVAHCAPPDNKPTTDEVKNCRPFLHQELRLLPKLRVVVALGRIAFDAAHNALKVAKGIELARKPAFGHGCEHRVAADLTLIGSYHPSQQNTFTGRLTEPMLDAVFSRAKDLADSGSQEMLDSSDADA